MKHKNIIKATLLLLSSLSTMCTGVVSPALPIIQRALEAEGATDIGLIVKMMVVVPNVFIAIFAPIFGYIVPKIGKLRLLFIALVVYAISGVSGSFLPTIYHIIFMRAILGITIAGILTVVTTLIADYFDGPERSSLIGMQTMFMSIGSTVYGLTAGVLADIGWRNIFYLYGMAIFYFPLAWKFLFNPDVVNHTEERIKTDRKIVQNNIAILLVCCINLFVMVMFYMIKLQLPYILYSDPAINHVSLPNIFGVAKEFTMNAKLVSVVLTCEVVVTTFVAFKYRRFKANRDFSVMCAMGLSFMALSYIMISKSSNYYMILVSMCVCGIGMGMLMPNSTLWAISITKPEKRPFFIGIFNTSTYAGKFLSPFIAIPLLYFIPNNPRLLFEICAIMMFFVAVLSMWMNDKFKRINKVIYRKELIKQREAMLQEGKKVNDTISHTIEATI
ncbi:MAG: MFS transporter [Rickettsiales bacterium]|nr:MFS transporter [Rickettsiales bacterium]